MKVTVLTLYHRDPAGFDHTPLDAFCRDHDILSCQPHFYSTAVGPALAMVLEYRDRPADTDWHRPPAPPEARKDIAPEHRPLFDALRRWRADRALREGKPHYVYLRNQELAAIASARPATRTALSAIGGIGEAKLASFGDELLAIVGAHCAAAVDKPPPQPGAAPVGSDAQ